MVIAAERNLILERPSIEVNILPDEIELALQGKPAAENSQSGGSLWHRVVKRPRVYVTVESHEDEHQVVRCSVSSLAPRWNPRCVRWAFRVRRPIDAASGDALAAQDILSEDGQTLTLLVLPGEQRTAAIEWSAELDGETFPGNYPFEVAVVNSDGALLSSAPGLLRLRHPPVSLLNYLPAIYSDTPEELLQRRFVTYEADPFFQTFYLALEDAVARMDALCQRLAQSSSYERGTFDRCMRGLNDNMERLTSLVERVRSSASLTAPYSERFLHGIETSTAPMIALLAAQRPLGPGEGIPFDALLPDLEAAMQPLRRTFRELRRFSPYEESPFFERFLGGAEDAVKPMQDLVANLDQFFDTESAPADFIPWLATWVSLVMDENWPELKRRRLIREAADLYSWRGTRRGLARYLELYADVVPQIHDQPFRGMILGQGTLLGRGRDAPDGQPLEGNTILGGVAPHTFVVTLGVPDVTAVNERIVRDIIESEKPAHTAYDLRIVERARE